MSITIRIGAAHDGVIVNDGKNVSVFDRAQMRKDGKGQLQGALRRAVVEAAFPAGNGASGKRNGRRQARHAIGG